MINLTEMRLPLIVLLFVCLAVQPLMAQKRMPDFSFQDLSGKAFTQENVKKNMATIVFFFDPYCDHCQQQAEWINDMSRDFKNIQLIWVSTETPESIGEFQKKHLNAKSLALNTHFLVDTEFMFDSYFGYSEAPSMYLYDKSGKRVKSFTKETPAKILLRYL